MKRSFKFYAKICFPVLALLTVSACGSSGGDTAVGGGATLANAGEDQEVLTGTSASLDGLASTGVQTVRWAFTSRPSGSSASISNSNQISASFTPDVVGEYVVQLSVNSGESTDSVTITANSVLASITVPSTSAISTRTRYGNTEYVMSVEGTGGELSSEGSVAASSASVASYLWEQIAGPSVTITGDSSTTATLSFTAPSLLELQNASDAFKWQLLPISRDDTTLVFRLTVTSSDADTDTDTFTMYIEDNGTELRTQSGLNVVGVGTTAYLSGPSSKAASTATAITDWAWTLTPPAGSAATFLDSGTTSSSLQMPRFVADVAGTYAVAYSSTSGATTGTINVVASEWVGVGTIGGSTAASPQCGACHDGVVQDDQLTGWQATEHASQFEDSMSLYASLSPEPYLLPYHTVGYNTGADNSGFDDLALDYGFEFTSTAITFSQFTSSYPAVAKLANVQCENCHGPGSDHTGDDSQIDFSSSQSGVCGQCHVQEAVWQHSAHNSTGGATGSYVSTWTTSSGCVRCHYSEGFIEHVQGDLDRSENHVFPGITCATCHDPHDATNSYQLRVEGNVVMVADGSTVNAGKAAVCYTCHDGFYEYGEDDCDSDQDGVSESICETLEQTAVEYFRQAHYNPQSPTLEGKGAMVDLDGDGTNDLTLDENSFHSDANFILASVTGDTSLSNTNDKCVTCHMSAGPSQDEPGYQKLGGHSVQMVDESGDEDIEHVGICQTCHGSTLTTFDREARGDYDGDGTVEGIQTEVQGLLLALSTRILALDTDNISQTSGTTEADGVITAAVISFTGTSNAPASGSTCATVASRETYRTCNFVDTSETLRRAIWNHNVVVRDASFGVHNAAYIVQNLQGTYTALGNLLSTTTFEEDYPSAEIR